MITRDKEKCVECVYGNDCTVKNSDNYVCYEGDGYQLFEGYNAKSLSNIICKKCIAGENVVVLIENNCLDHMNSFFLDKYAEMNNLKIYRYALMCNPRGMQINHISKKEGDINSYLCLGQIISTSEIEFDEDSLKKPTRKFFLRTNKKITLMDYIKGNYE